MDNSVRIVNALMSTPKAHEMQKNNAFDGRERDEPQSQHTGTHIFHRIVYSVHLLC